MKMRAGGGSFRAGGGSFRAAGCSPLLFLLMGNTNICSIKSDSFMIKYLSISGMMCGCWKLCLLLFLLVVGVLYWAIVF